MAGVISCASNQVSEEHPQSAQYREGKFHNHTPIQLGGAANTAKIAWRYLFEKPADTTPSTEIPVNPIDLNSIDADADQLVVYRLGHSSLLMVINGDYWLVDPVFSERASPFSWMGPKRFHQVPFDLNDLPSLRGILISHDHYDHLDEQTIRQLADRTEHFVVPLGVGQHLQRWGVDSGKVSELDWWQHSEINGVRFTAAPAQHFSGRGLRDGNQTLWASWAISSDNHSIFFSGDSGYFDGFKEIGTRLGPFDLTIIENGAYNELWSDVHMTPEQSLQAHLDLRGKLMMPVHNSTFDLALHAWYEPLDRLVDLAWDASARLATPEIGERLEVGALRKNSLWWEANMDEELALKTN